MKPKLIYMVLLFLLIVTLSFIIIVIEPFETTENTLEKKIQEIMTVFSEILCPVYKVIADDLKAEKKGTENEKNAEADLEIQKLAGGPVFPCPPPDDPIQIPADITLKIQRTVFFFEKKVSNMKEQLTNALGTCVDINTSLEGFQNICPPPIGESKSPPPPPSSTPTNCTPVHAVPPIIRKQIINARYNALVNIANQKQIIDALAKIKADFSELMEIKRKGEAGELASSCPT